MLASILMSGGVTIVARVSDIYIDNKTGVLSGWCLDGTSGYRKFIARHIHIVEIDYAAD